MLKKLIKKIFKADLIKTTPEGYIVEFDIDKYHNKGIACLNSGNYEKAKKMYEKEIECEGEGGFSGHWFLGKVLEKSGQKEKAKNNYEISLKNALKMLEKYPGSIGKSTIQEIREDLSGIK